MFEIGKKYIIKMLEEDSVQASYTLQIEAVDGSLIKSGKKIINTKSFVFISAELID